MKTMTAELDDAAGLGVGGSVGGYWAAREWSVASPENPSPRHEHRMHGTVGQGSQHGGKAPSKGNVRLVDDGGKIERC